MTNKTIHEEITDWMQEKLTLDINNTSLTAVHDFVLLWNVLDDKVKEIKESEGYRQRQSELQNSSVISLQCNSFAIPTFVVFTMYKYQEELISKTFNYIKDRYISNGRTNVKFDNLFMDYGQNARNTWKENVRTLLLDASIDDTHKLLVIAWVIYKYRCNLFHGDKRADGLIHQKENFEMANTFMLAVIKQMY